MHTPLPSKKSASKSASASDPFDALASVLRQLFAGSAAKGDADLPLPEPEEDDEDNDLFPPFRPSPMSGKGMRRVSISILMPSKKSGLPKSKPSR